MFAMSGKGIGFYLYTKLIGAGFSFSIIILFYAFFSSMKLYDLSEVLGSPLLWSAFYGYGIFCSILIDIIVKRWVYLQRLTMLLYIFAGFIIFVFLIVEFVYFIIAGTIGLMAALLFFLGVNFVTKSKWTSVLVAVLLPIILLFISVNDFTKKKDWEEVQEESKYEATFTYFNGEHKVPIKLKEGEQMLYGVDFYTNDGWGVHLEDAKEKAIPMGREQGDSTLFSAEEAGEYYIVIRGMSATGRFVVNWDIISN